MNNSILYIGGFDLPDKNAAAQRVVSNAKAFRNIGMDTFFIGLSKDKSCCNKIYEFEGFKYINLEYPNKISQWVLYLTSIKQYYRFLNNGTPLILIAYNFPSIALIKLRKWSFNKKIFIIADCTEWYKATGNILFRLIKDSDTFIRMKIVHPKLDGIITISNYLYKYYAKRMDNVIKIPPLVDLNMDKWKPKDLIGENEIINLVYVGSPGEGKKDRLDIIINILSQIRNKGICKFKFTIVGISENQYINTFNVNIPLIIKDNIFFKGRISHNESLNEIKQAHFNLFIRDYNLSNIAGFPTKFSESISCGTPVLTNSTSDIKDYIIDGLNGFLIESHDEIFMLNGILSAIKLPLEKIYLMKKYCVNCEAFSYKNYLSQFELLIKKLNYNK